MCKQIFPIHAENLLSGFGNNTYHYNHQGVRFKKTVNGQDTTYYNDGSRILGEDRGTEHSGKLRYFYDATGIAGVRNSDKNYKFLRDVQGNIIKIFSLNYIPFLDPLTSTLITVTSNNVVAEYDYDAFGNCYIKAYDDSGKVIPNATVESHPNHIAFMNPFRWKSFYWDEQLKMYYINGRYYDAQMGHYADADAPENLLTQAFVLGALDRTAITLYNTVSIAPNTDSIFTLGEFVPDPKDPNQSKTRWQVNWQKFVQYILFGLAILATIIVSIFNPVLGIKFAIFCIKFAITSMAVNGVIGGIIAAVKGNDIWDGINEGMLYGFMNGYTTAAVLYGLCQAFRWVKVANTAKPKPTAVDGGIGFDSFKQLKAYLGSAGKGKEWHHIVEQSQMAKSGFTAQQIHNTNNVVAISSKTHAQISGFYGSIQRTFTQGLKVRNWLAGQSFLTQYNFGIQQLLKLGVII